jgi:nucleoside-specific outer membrane channel protein Tsx
MKKTLLAAGAALAFTTSFSVNAADNSKPEYVSDWWHQSVNVVGSYHTRFGPQIRNDTYLEYEAFAKKDWFDFMAMPMPRSSSVVTPTQRYLEPRFSAVHGNRTALLD